MAAALVVAALGVASAVSAQQSLGAPYSVRDALAYSFASGLVASPVEDRIAWIENREGERNIWVAEGPEWKGRQLTRYTGDDGQELASLAFTPDGEQLLFVRGGAPNRQGEVPDPLYTPDEEGRAVWRIAVAGGEPVHVVERGGFAIAPVGARIAFSQGRDIMTLELSGDAEPERLARVRGGVGSLTWSPDGTRLAFVSNRGDHAFIGVADPDADAITYIDPSVGLDSSPAWSPDGRRLAFLRVPNERVVHMFAPRREALPFSLHVADATTGVARQVWRAREGVGSAFSGVNAASQLMWGAGDHLVFPWEGDGWKHLYSVPAAGGNASLLTPGDFEVQFVAMSPDGETVVYDSGQDDIDRKHVWRVSVQGGSPQLLTPGIGLEWGATVTAGGTVAFHASSTNEPSHTEVIVGGSRTRVSPEVMDRFPKDQLVVPQQVIFTASDGMQIHGQLFLPPDHEPGQRHPAALFFHGGSRRQMLLGFHHRGYYHNAYAFNQLLAASGYVVLAVNYRSGVGYGMEFREAENYGATGASEFADVLGAGLYLQGRDDVQGDRIGLWGGSYGGYLTALGLARASDLFRAGVDLHGVHDWNVVMTGFRPSYEPEDYPEFSRVAYESSPMAFMDGWRSPVLLIHGDDDRNVPFSETVDIAEALARRGVEFEQLIFPDEVHGFLLHRSWVAAYEAALDFLDRKLKAPIS
ncbi:MAG TPA: S9 family peptidase [Gemmatimonadetes bacterium]|nr:S9 family peptidase [Gemmatimonadota bacterium]